MAVTVLESGIVAVSVVVAVSAGQKVIECDLLPKNSGISDTVGERVGWGVALDLTPTAGLGVARDGPGTTATLGLATSAAFDALATPATGVDAGDLVAVLVAKSAR